MGKVLADLLKGLEILETRGDLGKAVGGIAYDSRQVKEGDLFVAVRGTRQDGHRYIANAVSRGASVVIAEEMVESGLPAACVRVADSRKALSGLAAAFYDHPSSSLKLIGVTGTNGKTTTTLLIESILKHADASVGVLGTLAYRWGNVRKPAPMTTPESLDLQRLLCEMHRDGTEYVVMEVSSHALALGRVEGCSFAAGVFTNLSQDHLDFHKNMEDYFAAKALLFTGHLGSGENPGVAVTNLDDPWGARLVRETKREVWTYSLSNTGADVWARLIELGGSGIRALLATPRGELELRAPLLGRLNLYNLLSAATTALALGIPMEAVSRGLEAVASVDGRLQRVPNSAGCEVIVDYAHTPDAMEKSLTCLRELTAGRLLVVFGCGGDRDRGKRPIMGRVAAELGDIVIVTSDNPRSEEPEAIMRDIEAGIHGTGIPHFEPSRIEGRIERGYTMEPERRRAIELALSLALPQDIVFIGGKGHETYQIIGATRIPFDDRQVVQEFYQKPRAASGGL